MHKKIQYGRHKIAFGKVLVVINIGDEYNPVVGKVLDSLQSGYDIFMSRYWMFYPDIIIMTQLYISL